MNRLMLAIMALLLTAAAQAATPSAGPMVLAQNLPGNNNPYNSPTRRANPNSMQGTRPNVPMIQNNPTIPAPRPPTLENGGIGNGYPRSGQPPASPRPNLDYTPPPRSTNNGNR
ncbi:MULTISPECIES: hypothetical protein [Pseudomonas]|jgi:hypothetical protein|uniref:Lipoprotein n=1 Tax=Pseudomonas bijieensis TaxID=2681983 RepID=A0A6N1C9H9_9PSED|nr:MULTISPECIES: hypothetical protein [Pseudomonas]QIB08757.1 hypothetical protein GZ982_29905 [Pseudomonas fluorescens]PWJ32579.1 hypothetical protein ATJ40_11382 [Pseudomonas sp. 43mfcvi1.1]QKS81165.1 hypothetical protein GN234_04045 [Pseudomonas bijieensis]WLH65828.1 hypothetical protein PSH86_15005 [Pseudomonas sp. FP2300]SSB98634.1 hypothetical protein SAMN04488697_11382 [Pseudomonas sp. 43mfcvi1.1]